MNYSSKHVKGDIPKSLEEINVSIKWTGDQTQSKPSFNYDVKEDEISNLMQIREYISLHHGTSETFKPIFVLQTRTMKVAAIWKDHFYHCQISEFEQSTKVHRSLFGTNIRYIYGIWNAMIDEKALQLLESMLTKKFQEF